MRLSSVKVKMSSNWPHRYAAMDATIYRSEEPKMRLNHSAGNGLLPAAGSALATSRVTKLSASMPRPTKATTRVAPGHAHHEATPGGAAAAAPAQWFDDLGTHHHAITTRVEAAQRFFDQGLRLLYAFNHDESIRSFHECARLDPAAPMCLWGIAL